MNKYKKVLPFNDSTTKEQSRVSSNKKKVFPDMIALQKQLKVSANINKFFPGLIATQEHLKVSPNIKKNVLSWVDKTTKELAQPIIPNVDTVMRRTPSTYESINYRSK